MRARVGGRVFAIATFGGALLFCLARLSGPAAYAASTPPQPQAAAKLAWTSFQDPAEKAFTVDVPQGWTLKGGLFRMGYSDERPMVDMTSADRSISIRFGDVSVPTYTAPNQFHAREGETYDLGAQAQMVVERYRTGPEFVVLYMESRFAKLCRNLQSDSQDASFAVPDLVPTDASISQSSTGQTAFHCDTDAGPRVAFAYAKTARTGDIWQAVALISYLAAPNQVPAAQEIILHAAKSFHLNPEWIEYQKRMDADGLQYQRARQQQRMIELQQQVQQFESKMRAMQDQVKAFERRQDAQAHQVEGFTNTLVGLTPTTDPLTGENRLVWTGPKDNYWVNGLGQVVNSTNAPAAGWRQLQTK